MTKTHLDEIIWPESFHFLQGSGLLVHLLAWLVVFLALFVVAPRAVWSAWRKWSPRAVRYRREVNATAEALSHGFVQYLASLDAADVFRTSHVSALLGDWKLREEALTKVVDTRLASMNDVLRRKESDQWNVEERAEFNYRYRVPLDVLFSPEKREWMFHNAGLSFTSYGKRFYPVLTNLGHTSDGMTATFHCEPFITFDKWQKALSVLSTALDSPGAEVWEIGGSQFRLFLNDTARRDDEMKVFDEHRIQDRMGTAEECPSGETPGMTPRERKRKNELFALINRGEEVELRESAMRGLWFTPFEAVRVLNQEFDYETASWVVRNIGNYQMYSGDYLWQALENVREMDEVNLRQNQSLRPRVGSLDQGNDVTDEDVVNDVQDVNLDQVAYDDDGYADEHEDASPLDRDDKDEIPSRGGLHKLRRRSK